jgi:hypothetical protein
MVTSQLILKHLNDPEKLEGLFREDPEAFRDSLDEALEADRESVLLRAWRARLEYREPACGAEHWRGLWYAIGIGAAAGALIRLPAIWLTEEWYYVRFAPLWIVLSLAAYFLIRRPGRALIIAGGPNEIKVMTIHITVVCETEAKDTELKDFGRIALGTTVTPRNMPLQLAQATAKP